ncbi:MAG: hypothetical protein GY856_54320 [bacterium]|nr:hypothetical protein [bacterium]
MIEMLLVVVMLGLLITFGLYRFGSTMKVLRLEGAARDMINVLNRARAEAVKIHVPTIVEFDFPNGRFYAFADFTRDFTYDYPGLLFDPTVPYRTADYVILEYYLPDKASVPSQTLLWCDFPAMTAPPFPMPSFPARAAVPATTITGFNAVTDVITLQPKVVAVFLPNGTLQNTGSYRITDLYGDNYLEISLQTRSGLTELRKYLRAPDAPGGIAGFYGRSLHATEERELSWVWY